MSFDLSIIIPVYNRGEMIRYTLESVRRASAGLAVETIIVDDGSTVPVAATLPPLGYTATQLIRQDNRGLLFARLAGFAAATGRYTVFLDSDDLVSPEKFRAQVAAMDAAQADVSTTDVAQTTLEGDYDSLVITPDAPLADPSDAAHFFIKLQPPPHGPVFRTDYLRGIVDGAFFPPSPLYNAVAEIWFYHNAAPFPARALRVPGPHTIIGRHAGVRLTNHWERLGAASLAVMEAFARHCPANAETALARRLVGSTAFTAWRRLPRNFSPEFDARLLGLWRRLPRPEISALGGNSFQALARVLGPVLSARLFRLKQNAAYDTCRTMTDADFARLLATLPPP